MNKQFYLLSQIKVEQEKQNEPRQFSGVANSGKPFEYYGQTCVVDLDNIQFSEKLPILLLHNRDKRVGFGSLSKEDNQLKITGTLLNNDDAQKIAQDADDGFPFQLSAHVVPNSVEEVKTGTVEVNGQTLSAPLSILRNCKVIEVSFTPTGVDDQTSATVLSDDGSQSNPKPQSEETTMTLEEALAQIEKLEEKNKALEEENAELKAKKKEADVEAQLSQAGFAKNKQGEFDGISTATIEVLLSLDDDKSKAMIADLAKSVQLSKGDDRQSPPNFMFGETNPPNPQDNQQTTDNPMLAVALSRAKQSNEFV